MQIVFSKSNMNIDEFNQVNQEYWQSSFLHAEVKFILSNVSYIAPMQACQLFAWIELLLKEKIAVELVLKQNAAGSNLFLFFYHHRFFARVDIYENFYCHNLDYALIPPISSKNRDNSLVNFSSFDNEEDFNRFLDKTIADYNMGDDFGLNVNESFLDLKNNLKNIVLRELGSNVFVHNDNSPAYLIIVERDKKLLLKKDIPAPIHKFANQCQAKKFFEVIVCDVGRGICETIRPSFKGSVAAAKAYNNDYANSHVLDFAFWKDSSSRDREKEELVFKDGGFPELVLPSGLFFIQELVKASKGMITTQCNGTLCTYSYINGDWVKIDVAEWKLKSEPLAVGTSISILIPKSNVFNAKKQPYFNNNDFPGVYKIISWRYNADPQLSDQENVESLVVSIKEKTRRRVIEQSKGLIVIDLSEFKANSKHLLKIIIHSMYYCDLGAPIILANFPEAQFRIESLKDLRRQTHYDASFNRIFWFNDNSQGVISISGRKTDFSFDKCAIEYEIQKYNKENVQGKIKQCFIEDAKVFVPPPSNTFLRGYFNLFESLQENNFCYSAVDIILSKYSNFDCIISTSKNLSNICQILAQNNRIPSNLMLNVAGSESLSKLMLFPVRNRFSHALILTDVIASGSTITRIKNALVGTSKEFKIFSFVAPINANVDYSFYSHKFELYSTQPASWRFDEIQRVNLETNSLRPREVFQKQVADEKIIEQWADDLQAIYVGHMRHDSTCYLSFFDTEIILPYSGALLRDKIIKDMLTILKDNQVKPSQLILLHVDSSEESAAVCKLIQAEVNNIDIKIHSFSKSKSALPANTGIEDSNTIVFFVDMAMTTTKTIRRALEWAANTSIMALHNYIFIDRTNSSDFDFIDGIERYKGVAIENRSIVKVFAASYTYDCPTCGLVNDIGRISEFVKSGILSETIGRWKKNLEWQHIKHKNNSEYITDKVSGKIHFLRHLIAKWKTSNYDLEANDSIHKELQHVKVNPELHESFIKLFWLESYVFKNSKFDAGFSGDLEMSLDQSLKNLFFDIGKAVLKSELNIKETKEKALWLMAAIDYAAALDITATAGSIFIKEPAILETFSLISCCFAKAETSEEIEKKLQNLIVTIPPADTKKYLHVKNIFIETIAFLKLKSKYKNTETSFSEAIKNLTKLFYERQRTHSKAMNLYTKRVNNTNSSAVLIKTAHMHDELEKIYMEEAFPSVAKLVYATSVDGKSFSYLTSKTYESDFRQIMLELKTLTELCKKDIITPEEIFIRREKCLRTYSTRFREQLVYKDNSLVYELLKSCKSDVEKCLRAQIDELDALKGTQQIEISLQSNCDQNSYCYVPVKTLGDIFYYLIENAYKYSETGSTVIVTLDRHTNHICFNIKSEATKEHHIEFKRGHGLENTRIILRRYDINMGHDDDGQAQIVTFNLPYAS